MPEDSLHERVKAALQSRRQKNTLRSLDPPTYDVSKLVDFSSNDYLSLSRCPELQESFRRAVQKSSRPYGPASSRLLDGNSTSHLELETRLATFFRGESALLFNSGFDANAGVFACLPASGDVIVYDELIHASVHDGMRASRAKSRIPFRHNSASDLKRVLEALLHGDHGEQFRAGKSQVFVSVEALYSMDGDLAPLTDYCDTLDSLFPANNAHLLVDEAHSTGLYGEQGRGLVCALGLANRVLVRLHTFGKAFACQGGVILCSSPLRNYFINYSRPLIYSTVVPTFSVMAIDCVLSHLERGLADTRIEHLHNLATHCGKLLQQQLTDLPAFVMPLPACENPDTKVTVPVTTPILPIITNEPRELSKYLISRGFLVRPITYPTVPRGQERVRICLHAGNTFEHIEDLVSAMSEWAAPPRALCNAVAAKL